jgi:hypothetical protein
LRPSRTDATTWCGLSRNAGPRLIANKTFSTYASASSMLAPCGAPR